MTETAKSSSAARRHVTTACRSCRDDKIKCGGEIPRCNQCASKQRQCTYSGLDRRKISNRKTIEVFSRRVRQLEKFIASHQLEIPSAPGDDNETLAHLTALFGPSPEISGETPAQEHIDSQSGQQPTAAGWPSIAPSLSGTAIPSLASLASMDMSQIETAPQQGEMGAPMNAMAPELGVPTNQAIDAEWIFTMAMMPQFGTDMEPAPEFYAQSLSGVQSSSIPLIRGDDSFGFTSPTAIQDESATVDDSDDDHDGVSNQLSARLGTLLLSSHGESHYYGSTSNYHLVQDEAVRTGRHEPSPSAEQVQQHLKTNGLDQNVEVELIDHLIKLYFTWHDPSLHIVDRELFYRDRSNYDAGDMDTPFYSPMLLNSMCAVGAGFEPKRHSFCSGPLSEFFGRRAVALLNLELTRPRMATVQALSVLSSHEIAHGRDTRAWVFSGMSARLSVDFGLHVSTQPHVRAGSMTIDEARGRSVVFWGSFATDRMWGLYLGRPFYNFSKAVSVERPVFFQKEQDEAYWESYGSPGSETERHQLTNKQVVVMEHWIKLSEIMAALEGSLYFQIDVSNAELQRLAHETFASLRAWKSNLPHDVNLDVEGPMPTTCLPHLLNLHLVYAYLVIVLHRPFVAKHYIQPFPLVGPGPSHARDMCIRSALQIAKLVGWYEAQHTLSRANVLIVQIIFSAALILVYATVSQNNSAYHEELFTDLEVCSRALAKLGDAFEHASRALDVLLRVKRIWQAQLLSAPVGSKRCRPSFSSWEGVSKRRSDMR